MFVSSIDDKVSHVVVLPFQGTLVAKILYDLDHLYHVSNNVLKDNAFLTMLVDV
ncbi:MAG: hypothetical protein ACREOZ_05090 [Gloeomargaritales cyanobacterium]